MRVDKNGNPEYILPKVGELVKECNWVIKICYYTGALKYIGVLQFARYQDVKFKWRLWHPMTWLYVIFAFVISMICHAIETILAYKHDIHKEVTCTIYSTNTKFKRNPLFKKEDVI